MGINRSTCVCLQWILCALVFMEANAVAAAQAPLGEPASEWRLRGGNAEAQYFSSLGQINEANVRQLGLAWSADLPTPDGSSGTPVVADGVIYLSGTLNIVYAYDLRAGNLLWTFDPKVRFSGRVIPSWGARITRGVAIWKDTILLNTADCRLIAIDAKKGSKIWESRVCKEADDYTITSAPRIGADKVFVGPNNADVGSRRGYVDAYDARTGKRLWRFYTIPGDPSENSRNPAMKMAAETWDPSFLKTAGAGSAWEDLLYDPVTKLLYVGVGGPSPWNPEARGPKRGDELFTNSIVALNAETGAYVWHYQTTPRDAWNLEPTLPMVLATLKIDGIDRRVLMEAPKNGFFYVIDPATGKLINEPKNFVPVNWAKKIDLKSGRPVMDPAAEYWKAAQGAVVMPGPVGGHNWMPMSYSPLTGLVYISGIHIPTKMRLDPQAGGSAGGAIDIDWYSNLNDARAPLIAWDPVKQAARWTKEFPLPMRGGVLSTAGSLVFQGSGTGIFSAYRATDGVELWSFDARTPIIAAPVTVQLDDRQLVIVSTGNLTSAVARGLSSLASKDGLNDPPRLLAFRIGAGTTLPTPSVPAPFAEPPRKRPVDAALVRRGQILFASDSCDECHGFEARPILSGSVPDLRRASAATHDAFERIVRGGALQAGGMPMFADVLSPEDVQAIQAFVLERAWQSYLDQTAVAR